MELPRYGALTLAVDDGVAHITLNRPDCHNAFGDELIAELQDAFDRLANEERVRLVVLSAVGKSFSAGADLQWLQRFAAQAPASNEADAAKLAKMFHRLFTLPQPTLALVQGDAYGGGVGLVAACDIAIAADTACFCLSEVKLGLIPAVIGPYVLRAIGPRAARRYVLSAERFDSMEARRLGLVHAVVPGDGLMEAGEAWADAILRNGPQAVRAAKHFLAEITGRRLDEALVAETARRIADVGSGAEAREGIAGFLGKRPPAWRVP